MSDQRGVFTLKTTNIFRKKEQWVDLNDVWHSPSPGPSAEVGYFGGGIEGGTVTTMDKQLIHQIPLLQFLVQI